MSDLKNENVEEGSDERVPDKYNLGQADLEKMTDFYEEKDDIQTNNVNNVDHLKVETAKVISLRADDLKLLTDEFELTKGTAERFLIKHNGNIKAILAELLGFN